MKYPVTIPPMHRCRGFSLMEVLVAMLVLAIGLLGLASLQAQSLKFNHDAFVRSQATILAYDIMDKMRAAPTADYEVPSDALVADPNAIDCTDIDAAVSDPSADMAVCLWRKDIENRLPSGRGRIDENAVDNRMFDVALQWSDRETDNQLDCEAAGRTWDGGNNVCLVTQTWTVFP